MTQYHVIYSLLEEVLCFEISMYSSTKYNWYGMSIACGGEWGNISASAIFVTHGKPKHSAISVFRTYGSKAYEIDFKVK